MGHEISWYLSPLLNWLSENWNPLFHEECFPLPCDKRNARIGYMDSLRRYMGDTDPVVEARGEAWFGWWQRHALRSCRRGGLFPDLFFRRMVDFSEISWGNFPVEGVGNDFYFTIPQGDAYLPIELVATPLLTGLQDAVFLLKKEMEKDEEWQLLAKMVTTILADGQLDARLKCYTKAISSLDGTVLSSIQNFIKPIEEIGFIRRLSPAVAMFGSLAPEISTKDLEILIPSYIHAHGKGGDSDRLRPFISTTPEFPANDPFNSGYDAALDLLETVQAADFTHEYTDIEKICAFFNITIDKVVLSDNAIRGIAFAGHSVTPTILLNTAHPKNLQDEGRRFSIGHELCHILHDRFFGSEVAIASGPWAPANIEKRANAFSAMLLMPLDLINPLIRSLPCPLDTLDGIHSLAKQLRVGRRALVWHLYNLSKLDEAQRLNLEQTMRASEEGLQRHE
ncbi:MAG: ImmA/IrrE family metallo-endopeptidase [Magnetococcales bacterium]|nr:ImmA/IrrE family metallo-endopeptidase [Magnetococcales bacterium]